MTFHRIGKDGAPVYGKKGAGMFITDGKGVLLLQRSNKGDTGLTWGIPGGKSEEGETLLGTAQRETKEEIGHLPCCSRLGDLESSNGRHIFKTFIVKVPKRFSCELSDEHEDYSWFDFDELRHINLHPKLGDVIDHILDKVTSGHQHESVNEMSGFADFISQEAIGGATYAILNGKKPKPDTYQIAGAPESMINPWKKKKKKSK